VPAADPFRHHPGLRGHITDPDRSFFRTFCVDNIRPLLLEHDLPVDWWFSDTEREALRARTLARLPAGDLWVFAYGSLMWDPAFHFTEVRRGHAPDLARRFILKDVFGARGRPEAPGLMAALDAGNGCEGLLFRIARDHVDEETERLWRREMIAPGYEARIVPVDMSDERVAALAFLADHSTDAIDATLSRAQQVEYIATGRGILGSSLEYLENIDSHFRALGIADRDLASLLRDARACAAST